MSSRTVVVGASLAGVRTVQALRRRGYDAPITLLGAESHLPYDRPPLSKEFLLGKLGVADVGLVTGDALAGLDVDLRLGTRATRLDRAQRQVIADAERFDYATLVVATGSTPRRLPGGDRLRGVHVLRTLDDAIAIRDALAAGARVVVVGAGFIGCEVASSARLLGLDVAIVDPLPAPMIRGVGAEIGAVLARRHVDNGAKVYLGRTVADLRGGERVEGVVLDDGTSLAADVVVAGIGVDPAVDWLVGSGLDLSSGIVCDPTLHAGDGIYAVGDVARWSSATGTHRMEHWTNAGDQASALAAVLTGNAASYEPIPYVWSDQLGSKLQVWGEVRPGDEVVYLAGDAEADEFVALTGGDGRTRGVVAFGARREAMRAQRLLRTGVAWHAGKGPVEPVA